MDLFSLLKNNLSPSKKIVMAITSKDTVALEEVLQSGFPVNSRAYVQGGDTALHLACAKENYDPSIVSKLIEHKADPSVKNDFGNTSINIAIKNEQIDLVTYLLENDPGGTSIDCFWNSDIISHIIGFNRKELDIMAVMIIATPNFSKYTEKTKLKMFNFATSFRNYTCMKMCIIFGEKLRPEQIQNNPTSNEEIEFMEWVENGKRSVFSLQHLCRMTVRHAFDGKHNILYGVELLNIPKTLKYYLKFNDLTPFGL